MEFAARSDLFATTAAWTTQIVSLDFSDRDQTQSAQTHFVTGDYFAAAGVHMQLGTTLPVPSRADDGDGEMVAVISDAMWRDLFAESKDVIGRTLRVNTVLVRIVGVAPPTFNGLTASSSTRTLWMPLASRATVIRSTPQALIDRDSTFLSAVATLGDGVSMERASSTAKVISDHAVARMTPAADRRIRTSDVVPLRPSTELPENRDALFGSIVFGGAAFLVLLVACTNVSALVVGAGITRSQEIAVRLSLGASRARLVRQLITESCVLALLGGALGFAVYALATKLVANSVPDLQLAPDFTTAAFTLLIAISTGVVFGISPALHATRNGVAEVLKSGGSGGGASARTRLQSAFIVAQIAVTQPLLVGVGVMLTLVSHFGDHRVDESVSSHVVRIYVDHERTPIALHENFRAAMRDLETLPGITQVVSEPFGNGSASLSVLDDSRAGLVNDAPVTASIERARPGYFSLLGIPIVRGRDLVASDTVMRDIAVVIDSDLAHELWGNADPIGRRFRQVVQGKAMEHALCVVGVYDASRGTTRGTGRRAFAIDDGTWRDFSYLVRTTGPARPAIKQIRDRLRATIPQIPIDRIGTLEEAIADDERDVRNVGSGVAAAGGLVLLLASIGLSGVIGLALAQRRREIGIRVALGAVPNAVIKLLFRQGLRLGTLGLLIGLPLSVSALAVIRALTSADDGHWSDVNPALIGGLIAFAVLLVTSLATWLPARKAARVDPMIALRTD
jgi:predicted permease